MSAPSGFYARLEASGFTSFSWLYKPIDNKLGSFLGLTNAECCLGKNELARELTVKPVLFDQLIRLDHQGTVSCIKIQ